MAGTSVSAGLTALLSIKAARVVVEEGASPPVVLCLQPCLVQRGFSGRILGRRGALVELVLSFLQGNRDH